MKKTRTIPVKVTDEEAAFIKSNAERYFGGNVSILMRKAALEYKQGNDPHVIITLPKKSKK